MTRWLVVFVVLMGLAVAARADVTVTLRPVARVDGGATITIGDVAEVVGGGGIAAVPMGSAEARGGRAVFGVDDVRAALNAAGVGRAGVSIRGESCVVVFRERDGRGAAESIEFEPAVAEDAPALGLTVRDHVRARLAQLLDAGTGELDVQFDTSDAELLGRATAGLTVDVHSTGLSRRTPIRVTLYGPDGSMEVHRVLVGVRLLREVARATRPLERGASVTPEDFAVSNEWLAPDEAFAEPGAVVGQRLRRGVDSGELLSEGNVEPPIVIERGDIVVVHVVSGTVVLRRESRATESGRVGQRIRLEPVSGGASFRAEIQGPGRAVIVTRTPAGGEDA